MGASAALAGAALLSGGLMDALGLGKAWLRTYKPIIEKTDGAPADATMGPKEKEYKFDYNPKDLKFSGKANMKPTSQAGGETAPPVQYRGRDAETHEFELFYSRFELPDLGGGQLYNDLNKIKDELLALVQAHPSTIADGKVKCPPLVEFGWGSFHSKLSFVETVNVMFEMFLPNGTPMRMKATIKITEAAWKEGPQNPTSGGKTARRTHMLLAGETLAAVAFKEYANPTMWRAIAEENGIDDPFRLISGTELLLPPLDEAVELA
jgi:nucleoid-associated protein YgaU